MIRTTQLLDLDLFQFRNLADQKIVFPNEQITALVGPNGQGKTNILEAIYLLGIARSFRTSKLREISRWSTASFSVFGNFSILSGSNASSSKLEIGGDLTGSQEITRYGVALDRGKKQLFKDNQEVLDSDQYLGDLPIVAISPADMDLIKGAPEFRRRFIDKHIIDSKPAYFSVLHRFHRALRGKQQLLKGQRCSVAELISWNQIFAQAALELTKERTDFIANIRPIFFERHQQIAPGRAQAEIKLRSKLLLDPKEDQKTLISLEDLLSRLDSIKEREIELGHCLLGPHRDELEIVLAEKDARSYASQGQSKTLALALKLAALELIERRRSQRVILLLDEVEAELDLSRRQTLHQLLSDTSRQTILSTTDAIRLQESGLPLAVLTVNEGVVSYTED